MKKKLLSVLLALSLMLTLLPAAALAASYSDTAAHWAESSIERWSDYGIIQGNNGAFLPDNNLTRAHMATILAKLLKLPAAESAGFTDVDSAAWYADAVNRCAAAGIMLGNAGKANPNATITRAQAIVMLGRALGITPKANADLSGYEDAAAVPDYAKGYVAAMSEAGIVKGSTETTVAPASDITRAATVTILDRAIEVYANESGKTVNTTGSGIVLVVADDVTINGRAKDVLVAQGADASSVYLEHAPTATVTITAEEATVYVKNSSVKEASIIGEESKIVFEGESQAETVTVSETAKGAQVVINEGAKVETVANKAEDTVVTGSGSVGLVTSSENLTVETYDTKVENTNETKEIAVTDKQGKENTVTVKTESTGTGTVKSDEKPDTTVNVPEKKPSGGGHSHSYSTAWTSDATEHWHAATCGHDVTSDRAAHTFGDYTSKDNETHSRTCTVCGYEETAAAHSFGDYTDNGNTHSHTCTDCNYTETEAHVYDETTLRCVCGKISPDAVAAIGEKLYTSLDAAITAAVTGETVVLLKDVTEGTISADVTIRSDGFGLTVTVASGKTLTITEGTFPTLAISGNGTCVITGGTFGNDPSTYVAVGYQAKANEKDPETWTVSPLFASGSGTEKDPFKVATAEQFANIGKAKGTSTDPVYIELTADVDLADATANSSNTYKFNAVVSKANYIVLDGNDYKITYAGNDIESIFGDFIGSTLKNANLDLSCPVSGYLVNGSFENVEVDGFMEFSNNTGVMGFYCSGATLKNVHVKANVVSTSYSAVFFGYNFGADYTLTDCSYSGNYVGSYAGLVFGNATYNRATVAINNFTLNGTVRHTNNDASAYNPLVAICSDGQWSNTTKKVLTIDGVAVSNEKNAVSAIEFNGNGGYLTGPVDNGLSISVNQDKTFTIGESEFNNAHHYVVEIVANVTNNGPYGGSTNISVWETIQDDGSTTHTTKLKDFGFANGDAATSKLADTWDIITIGGTDYYWESNPDYVCGTRGLNTEVFVRAYDDSDMLLSSAILSR